MAQIRLRRDDSWKWTQLNPVLAEGEPGFERDTGRLKIGDGSTRWSDLPYFTSHAITLNDFYATAQDLLNHVNAQTPHPVYDDGPSLLLLYQNAKV